MAVFQSRTNRFLVGTKFKVGEWGIPSGGERNVVFFESMSEAHSWCQRA